MNSVPNSHRVKRQLYPDSNRAITYMAFAPRYVFVLSNLRRIVNLGGPWGLSGSRIRSRSIFPNLSRALIHAQVRTERIILA